MRRRPRHAGRALGLILVASLASACVVPPPPPGLVRTYAGLGFDACDIQGNTNAVSKLQTWYNASPYRAVGLYLGGRQSICPTSWSPSTLNSIRQMGWQIIPIYVDLQAPCAGFGGSIPWDFNGANSEGINAANGAVSRMQALGITGTYQPIYLDVEAYNNTDGNCVNSVRWFVSAWTGRLHQLGYLSGLYSSAASGVADQSAIYGNPSFNQLDAIWFAHWNGDPSLIEPTKAWLPDNIWTNHQRLHQYDSVGGESHGGVTMNIDRDSLDAPVVG